MGASDPRDASYREHELADTALARLCGARSYMDVEFHHVCVRPLEDARLVTMLAMTFCWGIAIAISYGSPLKASFEADVKRAP